MLELWQRDARRRTGSRYRPREAALTLWLIAARGRRAAARRPRCTSAADILTAFTEKSDDFAQTFVHHGTFGFVPGEPSAYTQPLYGWFLIPIYWIFGRTWSAVGLAQIVVGVVTALLVYEIGAAVLSRRAGTSPPFVATLNPYLVWHDVHVNREIARPARRGGARPLTLIVADRRSTRWAIAAGIFCRARDSRQHAADLHPARRGGVPVLRSGRRRDWVAPRR